MTKENITVIFYTSNFLDDANPYFLENVKKQLVQAVGDLPMVIVSQKEIPDDDILMKRSGETYRHCVGDIGRSHLNIYRAILEGCYQANTEYVAMAEDDILYSFEHFHSDQIDKEFAGNGDVFLYDMNKMSLFTWTKPPMYSFRTKRKVVNQLIAPRKMLIEALEERFRRLAVLVSSGVPEENIIKYWGDPGRYEKQLGVSERPSVEFYCNNPSIVFSHEHAYGYLSQGSRKRLGDIRIIELYGWGRAEDILKLYKKND